MVDLTHQLFTENLNSGFKVRLNESTIIQLNLVEVSELKDYDGSEAFSAVFLGPQESPLQQSLYQMEHDRIGTVEIFLVPVGQNRAGYQYEAVFNRLKEPEASTPSADTATDD